MKNGIHRKDLRGAEANGADGACSAPAVRTPEKGATGTKEWAASNVNIQTGCEHDCGYCYAKAGAVRRHQVTVGDWQKPVLRPHRVSKNYRKRPGTIMFPSTHDITPLNVETCIGVLERLLAPGNRVLIVSKPHLACVKALCRRLEGFRSQILFRFTIGSADDRVLKSWEPGAPRFAERLAALRYAREQGFETSVSCEPMLDADIDAVINAVRPYTSQSIWLGRVNRLMQAVALNCPGDNRATASARKLLGLWTDDAVRTLYARHKDDPLIRWKDSIKQVVGLPAGRE